MHIVDSPVESESDPPAVESWCVVWQCLEKGLHRIWPLDDKREAIAYSEAEGNEMLNAAKKSLDKIGRTNGGGLAAVSLRLYHSKAEEI